jgi:hypothetical protein
LSRKRKPNPMVSTATVKPPKWQRERSIALYIWILIPIVIAVVAGLVGFWAYDSYVAAWREPVVRVNDTTVDMDHYVKMLRVYGANPGLSSDLSTFAYQVVTIIEDREVMRQSAPELGVEATPEEITAAIEEGLTAAIPGNTTPTREEMDELYAQFLERVKVSDSEYRAVVETQLLSEKVLEYLDENEVPAEAEQVFLNIIPMADQELAGNVTAMLRSGGNFTAAAMHYSVVEEVAEVGGVVGWVPRGIYPELDDVVFSAAIGNVTDPIAAGQGFYVAMVSDVAENMPIGDDYRQILTNSRFESWMEEQKAASIIEQYLNEERIAWAFDHF